MSLSDIKNKLYKKDLKEDIAQHSHNEFDIETGLKSSAKENYAVKDEWEREKAGLDDNQRRIIKTGAKVLGGIAVIAILLVAVFQFRKSAFSEERVTVAINGPADAESGQEITYEIAYKNDNRATLGNAVLKIVYPESFKPSDNPGFKTEGPANSVLEIGNIDARKEGKIAFKGRAFSPKGSLMYLRAELSYVPSNFNSNFVSKNQLGINITSSPVTIEIMAPLNLSTGDSLDYLVTYKNIGTEDVDGMRVKLDYPGGFTFANSNPKVSEGDNIWYLGTISAGQEGKIVISGKLEGDRDEIKKVKVYIGAIDQGNFVTYSEENADTKIAVSPLAISQTVNGQNSLSVNSGEELRFEINYKNIGDQGLRDVIVTEKIDSPALDYASLDFGLSSGGYDANNKIITWKASDVPDLRNLEPGKSGTIKFSIKVKDILPINTANDKNFIISSIAKIDSPDIPTPLQMNKIIAGNRMDMKLNSKLVLDTKAFYNDGIISNTGPIPPLVDQETTYTVHWKAMNISNDVTGARVVGSIPTGVIFTGKMYPEDANLTFDERTNTLVWELGNLSAGTGILTAQKEVAFQVKLKPAPHQFDTFADIFGTAAFTAKDTFTGEDLKFNSEKKTTMLPEDKAMDAGGYKVKK